MSDQTIKQDAGKPRLTLVPMQIMFDIAEVREFGCKKYDPEGWKRVEPERIREAAFRHFLRYIREPYGVDDESGILHRKHLECNLAFLAELEGEDVTKREIENLIVNKQKAADRNYNAHQETGMSRYLREREKAEDIIEICKLALSALDDHNATGIFGAHISKWGVKAIKMLHEETVDGDAKNLLEDIKSVALKYGLATDPWRE